MQNFENGKTYRLINKADTSGRALNAYSASTPSSLTNVCLYTSDEDDDCQKWQYVGTATRGYFVCKANTSLVLDQYTGTSGGSGVTNYNAHLYTLSSTSYVIPVYTKNSSGEVTSVKLKLECDQTKFLTANENANGTSSGKSVNSNGNVYWYQSAGVTQYSQDWLVEEVDEVKPNPPTGSGISSLFLEQRKTYRLINMADNNRRVMSAYPTSSTPSPLANVCLAAYDAEDERQKWVYIGTGTRGHFLCRANTSLALDQYTASSSQSGVTNYNAHLYEPSITSNTVVSYNRDENDNIISVRIRLNEDNSKYLTANVNANGTASGVSTTSFGNVYWKETTSENEESQNWIVEEVEEVPDSPNDKLTLAQLKAKFPPEKYWNHVGMSGNNQDGYTDIPCPSHNTVNTCNAFETNGNSHSWQCLGFAEKCGYDATGFNPHIANTLWIKYKNLNTLDLLKAGDIVRYMVGDSEHAIFVTGVNGDDVTYGDCNGNAETDCKIRWDISKSKEELLSNLVYVNSAPCELT